METKSLEDILEKYIPETELQEVKRILYGKPCRYDFFFILYYLT